MQWRTAIKWLHGALTAILLLVVIGFIALNSSDDRAEEHLISSRQLNDNTWLYVTGYRGGGATVANTYRYYLSGKVEGDSGASLAKHVPFLVAAGSGANVTMDGEVIDIKYGGRVFSFSNAIIYEYRGETFRPRLNFQARN